MNTNKQIKYLISQLDIDQIKAILIEYYSENNHPFSIYNATNKSFNELSYNLYNLVVSGEIDEITIIIEMNS